MSSIVYLNGEYLPRSEAKLSVDERGFFFGDGVYEVTRAVDGRLFESGRHMKRLARGLRELRLDPPISLDEIEAVSLELLKRNDITSGEGTVYLQITRGAAPRTHHFPPPGTPCTVFLSAQRWLIDAVALDAGGNFWGGKDPATVVRQIRGQVTLTPFKSARDAGY